MKKDEAIALFKTKFWESLTDEEIVKFQLFEERLCMPFNVFHKAIENVLDREVFTHEFGLSLDEIKAEFLGEKDPPTFEEILNMIPEEKRRVLVFVSDSD